MAAAFGPVETPDEARTVLSEAIAAVQAGDTVVVDMRIARGYSDAMAEGMTQDK